MKNTMFNSKEEYYQFIQNWKDYVNNNDTSNQPELFVTYNLLKNRNPLYGFSEYTNDNTKWHLWNALCNVDKSWNSCNKFINKIIDESKTNELFNLLKDFNSTIWNELRDVN